MKFRLILFTFFILHFTLYSYGQYDPSRINKKAVETYNHALEQAQGNNYEMAIASLNKAIQLDPNYIEAYLSLAGVYGQLKNYDQSASWYEKAFALDSNYSIAW